MIIIITIPKMVMVMVTKMLERRAMSRIIQMKLQKVYYVLFLFLNTHICGAIV